MSRTEVAATVAAELVAAADRIESTFGKSRATSLARTKLDEARHWLTEAVYGTPSGPVVPAAGQVTMPLPGQVLMAVPGLDEGDYVPAENYTETTDLTKATVTTSRVAGSDAHKVVLDIDLPATLLPSSTPGHFHLYIDKPIEWDKYSNLLNALADAGLIEDGYNGASQARGFTAVRLPWVRKGETK